MKENRKELQIKTLDKKAMDKKTLESINEALEREKDLYIKCIIIILATTGMRMKELSELTIRCIQTNSTNEYFITWFDSKMVTSSLPMLSSAYYSDKYVLPVNIGCVKAIEKLIETTKELREQADVAIKDYLFIHRVGDLRSGEIKQLSYQQMQYMLKAFAKRHNIFDVNGEPYNLSSHQFRHIFLTIRL